MISLELIKFKTKKEPPGEPLLFSQISLSELFDRNVGR